MTTTTSDQLTLDFTTPAPSAPVTLARRLAPPPLMSIRDLDRMARDAMREHGLFDRGWSFGWDNAKARLGVTDFGKRRITLSKPIFSHLENREQQGLDTILHEIAHVLAGPAHGHDAVWKATARKVGARPERCADRLAVRPDPNWWGACGCGDKKHGRQQKPQAGRTWTCRLCRQKVSWWREAR